jgi:sulfur carrier protein
VIVNDVPQSVPPGTSLLALLGDMALSNRPGVAVAVNASVVCRGDWEKQVLRAGDQVLVLHASQGG